mmetsp:Transcript_33050/g.54677  ORF Transcript_33050/g.54677 Transcript_33050/m.54677 type:complete len:213 (-) Transcript_33050:79-717(-)
MLTPTRKMTSAGITKAERQAISPSVEAFIMLYTPTMKICVTPPPRLPQPPVRAWAPPTTFLANICAVQNWQGTNTQPITPWKKRTIARSVPLFTTKPPTATGMQNVHRMSAMQSRPPKRSHRGPIAKRNTIVLATEQMFATQISSAVKPMSSLILGIRGANENQARKATKKPSHAKWKALMWGFAKLQTLISVALSPWAGSTFSAYWGLLIP